MQYNRPDRVGELVKEEVAKMITYGEIKDPRIGMVTILGVKMTRDLKSARVYFSMVGTSEDIDESKKGLNSASGYIKKLLASRLKLKRIQRLVFEYDDSLEYSIHIEKLLNDVKKG